VDDGNIHSPIHTRNVGGPILRKSGQEQERKNILIGNTKVSVVKGIITDEKVNTVSLSVNLFH